MEVQSGSQVFNLLLIKRNRRPTGWGHLVKRMLDLLNKELTLCERHVACGWIRTPPVAVFDRRLVSAPAKRLASLGGTAMQMRFALRYISGSLDEANFGMMHGLIG